MCDPATAAAAAADITWGDLLNPARLNRVADQGGREAGQLTLAELLSQSTATAFPASVDAGSHAVIRRRVQARLIARLAIDLQDKSLSPAAAAEIRAALTDLGHRLDGGKSADARYFAALLLDPAPTRLKALAEADTARKVEPPPGMPIGGGEDCWFCGPAE